MDKLLKINFNLLKSLEALLKTQSVQKAAAQLCVTPPAMSLNLKQLREYFDDALLVRGQAGSMRLTDKSEALIPEVDHALSALSQLFIHDEPFNPEEAQGDLLIGASQYIAAIVVPILSKLIQQKAPNIRIVVKNILAVNTPTLFTDRHVDMVFSYFDAPITNVRRNRLFSDQGVLIAPKNHMVWAQYNGSLASLQHCEVIVFTQREKIYARPESVLSEKHLPETCQVRTIVSDPLVAIKTAAEIGAVTYASERLVQSLPSDYGLRIEPLQFPTLPDTYLYWHEISQNSPLLNWVREALADAFILSA